MCVCIGTFQSSYEAELLEDLALASITEDWTPFPPTRPLRYRSNYDCYVHLTSNPPRVFTYHTCTSYFFLCTSIRLRAAFFFFLVVQGHEGYKRWWTRGWYMEWTRYGCTKFSQVCVAGGDEVICDLHQPDGIERYTIQATAVKYRPPSYLPPTRLDILNILYQITDCMQRMVWSSCSFVSFLPVRRSTSRMLHAGQLIVIGTGCTRAGFCCLSPPYSTLPPSLTRNKFVSADTGSATAHHQQGQAKRPDIDTYPDCFVQYPSGCTQHRDGSSV